MNKVGSYFIEAVSQIMQLLCMVAVVAEHVCEKCQSLFRRRCCGVTVRVYRTVRVGMSVDVSVMLMGVCYGIVFRMIVIVHFVLLPCAPAHINSQVLRPPAVAVAVQMVTINCAFS